MSKPESTPTAAKRERQSCGKYFFDCTEPSDTVYLGVMCLTCGAVITTEYFDAMQKDVTDAG